MGWARGSTRSWRHLRSTILERDPTCRLRYPGCTIHSTQVDHVINVAVGGTDHPANLQGVCHHCHRIKSQREATAGRPTRRRPTEPHPGLTGGAPPTPMQPGHRNV